MEINNREHNNQELAATIASNWELEIPEKLRFELIGNKFSILRGALEMSDLKDKQFKEFLEKKKTEFQGKNHASHIKKEFLTELINEFFK